MKLGLTFALLLITIPAFGSTGGNCPSGSNYLDASTNNLVTLSSLGITNCYYIAANGSDSNSGTSESSPWLHAPQMPACSANCASAQNQYNGIPAGTGLILRGGDTWHFGNSSASPYSGGTWNFNSGQYPMGNSSHPIYVGVDPGWYSGSVWARPILNGDNPICDSAGGGCNQGTTACSGSNCPGSYYVSSCPYQIGGENTFLEVSGLQYYIIDNLEMTGLCQSDTGQPGHHDVYVSYGSLRATMTFQNLYIHGWSHLKFAGANGGTSCTGGSVCFNIFAFNGSVMGGGSGEVIHNNVVDGADSDPIGAGLCFGGFYDVAYNAFRYTSQCVYSDMHVFHDNLYEDFYENGHSNMLEGASEPSGTNAVYNNVFRHIESYCKSGCGIGFWPIPPVGTTDYYFNNLIYDQGAVEGFNVGQNGKNQGPLMIFNNTIEWALGGSFFGCPPSSSYPYTVANNHYIIEQSPYGMNCGSQQTAVTNLQMSHSTANSDGYTSSETFAYSPGSSGLPTVGGGTNENSSNGAFCSALANAGLSDAANVCQSDTPYSCTYNTKNNTVSCPARSTNARSASGAWDIGAYEYNTQDPPPAPPSGLTAIVN
jgi:hypothetical protein